MGRIGDFTFYSAIAAYQEFFQGEATILLWNTHLGWNELPMYCEKIWLGGGGSMLTFFTAFFSEFKEKKDNTTF